MGSNRVWLRDAVAEALSCKEITNRVWLRASVTGPSAASGCQEVTNRVWLRDMGIACGDSSVARRSQTGCGCEKTEGE